MPTRPALKIRQLMSGQPQPTAASTKKLDFFVLHWLFPGLLAGLAVLLAYLNHVPGTWLTGWDTLHPEFNFWLNLQRVVMGLFRTDQGLGTIAAHAHYVELPRILILWAWSLVVPTSLLRYLYVSVCLVLGPVGVYFWLKKVLAASYGRVVAATGAFGAGVWYLFNLGTLQHFVVPFEMFPTNYAAMGWTFWLALQYLEKPRRRWLLTWLVFQFWASNMAYSFVSWYVYFVALAGFLVLYAGLKHWRLRQPHWKPALVLIATAFIANAYWLFPNWYFVANNSWHVPFAKNNQLISEEIFYHNKEYGTLIDTITMKNHLFNWQIRDGQSFVLLFKDVSAYLDSGVIVIPMLFFGVILVGYLIALIKTFTRKVSSTQVFGLAFLPIMLAGMLSFLSLNPPLETLIAPLRESISVLREGLRNPFIKVNIVLMASYALGFGLGVAWLTQATVKLVKQPSLVSAFIAVLILGPSLILGKPFFEGHLIDARVQQEIPTEYFQMFEWFKTQPTSKRVLVLPAPSFWAWDYHSWGYQGAGFMWFGLPQPFLSRDSDRWSPYNEEAYREISQAIAENNWKLFYSLLEKYHVGWVIFDKTVVTNGEPNSILNQGRIEQFLKSDQLFTEQVFSDQLSVFTNQQLADTSSFVLTYSGLESVTPEYFWHYHDAAHQEHGSYFTVKAPTTSESIFYPGRSLLTQTDRLNTELVSLGESALRLQLPLESTSLFTYSLGATESLPAELSFRVTEDEEYWLLVQPLLPFTEAEPDPFITVIPLKNPPSLPFYLSLNNDFFLVSEASTSADTFLGTTQFEIDGEHSLSLYDPKTALSREPLFTTTTTRSYDCGLSSSELITHPSEFETNAVSISTAKTTVCTQTSLPTTPTLAANSWLVTSNFSFESDEVSEAEFCLLDTTQNQCLNKQTVFNQPNSNTPESIEVIALADGQTLNQLNWLFVTEPQTLNSEVTQVNVKYSQPELSFTPASADQKFQLRLPSGLSQPNVAVKPGEDVQIPYVGPPQKADLQLLNHPLDTCGSTNEKAVLHRSNVQDTVEFSAQYGQVCDRVVFGQALHNQGQLVSITARNVSGLPARVCVRNLQTDRCDLYVPLADSDEFITETFVLPPMARTGSGYAVSFITFAPGREPSVNQIKSVSLQPFPYEIVNSFQTLTNQESRTAVVYPHSFQPGFVAGWHKGWSWEPLPEHVLINNWANGWLTTEGEIQEKTSQGYTLRIFFWPLGLELVGLGLGGVTLLYLLFQPLIKRMRRHRQ